MLGDETPVEAPPASLRSRWASVKTKVPPARMLWILLIVLGGYGVSFLGSGLGIEALVALPIAAVTTDLVIARVRFEKQRFPDAAIATGLLVALLFPPVVPLFGAIVSTIAAMTLKNVLRFRGRPWFNPAASGVILGALLFGFSPAWWGSISEFLTIGLGAVLIAWNLSSWRIPVVFIAAYAGFAVLQRTIAIAASGGHAPLGVLFLAALDPSILFFGLFMVVEPRTAPSDPVTQPVYAVTVAAMAALLPIVFPTLAVFVALIVGNFLSVVLRRRRSTGTEAPSPARAIASLKSALRPPDRTRSKSAAAAAARWSVPRRAAVGIFVFIMVAWLAAATYNPSNPSTPILSTRGTGSLGGYSGPVAASSVCAHDNASIPSATLTSLHKSLGPSEILQYQPKTGVVVFFDPVNQVTVTETDMYEDFGYAEFNGDDYTSAGCVPP